MKRLLTFTLAALLIGAFTGYEKEKLITGPTEYDTTEVVDTTIVVDTVIQYDTTIVYDTVDTSPDILDYYFALQLWINPQLNPYGLDSYYPTVNTYDITVIINNPTQMTFDVWWPAFNFTTNELWYYWGMFRVVYNGPGNWQVTDITPSGVPSHPRTQAIPVRTLR